jgi:hypothetical protein
VAAASAVSDIHHVYPISVEAKNLVIEPNPEVETIPEPDEAWLERAEAEAEIAADWDREIGEGET